MPHWFSGSRASRWLLHLGRRLVSIDHLWLAYLVVALAGVAGLFVFGTNELRTWTPTLLSTSGAVAMGFGARRSRAAHAGSWYGLALGVFLLGAGDLVWAILAGDTGAVPTPSLADAVYLSGYLSVVISLASLAWPRGAGASWDTALDTAIASLGVGLVAWVFMIAPSADLASGSDLAGVVVNISYPAMDVALAVVAVGMAFGPQRSRAFQLLFVALTAFLVSDVLYLRGVIDGTYVSGGWPDLGYFVGYAIWGASGLHPSAAEVGSKPERVPERRMSKGRAAGLVASCLLAPAMLLWSWATGRASDLPLIAAAGVALIMLWAARLALMVRHLDRALDERARLEGQLRVQAERDPLVGLLNRASFLSRLRAALTEGEAVAVLFIDLDDFKVMNDTFGHPGGDAILVEIAHRLAGLLRPPDLAARLGGDEFGVLLPAADTNAAEAVASRVLASLARPISVEGRTTYVHASVGIGVGGPRKAAEDVVREADVAMYLAKAQGKNRHVVFEAAMHADVIRRIALRSELEEAITAHEFTVLYQPIVTAPDGVVTACEALVRWQHPVRGLLTPAEFIDLAEETGLIVALGRWMLDEACREAAAWHSTLGPAAPGVAINVSALQVRNPSFAADVRGALERSGLDPRRLIVELTESILIEVDSATSLVAELGRTGVRIAIDDFGTGYSSLAYLATYPVDILKIDRSFVASLDSGPREARLISAIIALGTDLGLSVIAEGVETEKQLNSLVKHGCTAFQGYLFARPMPAHDLMTLLVSPPGHTGSFARDLRLPLPRIA